MRTVSEVGGVAVRLRPCISAALIRAFVDDGSRRGPIVGPVGRIERDGGA